MADDLRGLLGNDLEHQVHRVDLLLGGDVLQALADVVRELLAGRDHDLLGAAELVGDHPPHQGGELRFAGHALAELRPRHHWICGVGQRGVGQREGIGRVGILVGRDLESLGAGLFDHGRGVADAAPVGNLHRLEVRDMDRRAGLAADADGLGRPPPGDGRLRRGCG